MIRKSLNPGRDSSKAPTANVEIKPQSIGDITVSPSALYLLTLCNMKVVIDLTLAGVQADVVDLKGNHIGSLTQFITATQIDRIAEDYKKTCMSDIWRREICAFLFRVAQNNTTEFIGYTNEVLMACRPWLTILKILDANFEKLKVLDPASEYFQLAREFYVKSRNTVEEMMIFLATGKRPLIKDLLYEANVPYWVYKKLVTTNLTFDNSKDYRFFFPSSPRRAITLSIKELRNPNLMKDCSILLGNSEFLIKLATDQDVVQAILGEDPRGNQALLALIEESVINLIPPTVEFERHMRAFSNPQCKGIDLPFENFWDNTPINALPAFSAVFIQVFYLSFRLENYYEEFLKLIVPQVEKRTATNDIDYRLRTYDLYKIDKGNVLVKNILEGEEEQLPKLVKWISDFFGNIPKDRTDVLLGAMTKYKKCASKPTEIKNPVEIALGGKSSSTTLIEETGITRERTEIVTLFGKVSKEDCKVLNEIFKELPSRLKVKKRNENSLLTKEAKSFLIDVGASHSKDLSKELESYFCSLSGSELQKAIVKVAHMKFDTIVADFELAPVRSKKKEKDKPSLVSFDVSESGDESETSDTNSVAESGDQEFLDSDDDNDENRYLFSGL